MLDYLIRSDARRGLLVLLWAEGVRGNASVLARRAGITPAAARRELLDMRRLGIAREVRTEGARVFEAHTGGPHADALEALARLPTEASPAAPATLPDDDRTRNALTVYGARLKGHRVAARTDVPLEEALAAGCELAHRDVAVAKVMPRLLHAHRRRLDPEAFEAAAQNLGVKHTAGFLLALASKVGGDTSLGRWAETLRDDRRKRPRPFFIGAAGPAKPATTGTLPIAKKWAFHFPLPLAFFPKR
ncbi:MAG: hypothetical protein PVI30_02560 [Myxococcales bacterium]|jgi:hypothetical protein